MIKDYRTPCYIFDRNDFENNIQMFKSTLTKYFGGKWKLGYSFKTNYLPYLLRCAKEYGCFAEVVSEKEYLLAKAVGFKSEDVIYNGPVKKKSSFVDSCIHGGIVNIDSQREIEWLGELPQDKQFTVGIRVNFDLEHEMPGHTLMGLEGGRFGFCYENGELHNAIIKMKKLGNIAIKYLHMHVSSKTKSVDIYKELVKKACQIIEEESLDINFVDVGGSFFGGGDDGSSYEKYVKTIKETLLACKKEDLGIIVEPGASVVASSFSYLIEVVDKKSTTKNNYVVTDGSRLHIDPFFARSTYSYELYTDSSESICSQVVAGFTCMEKDRIMKLEEKKELMPGDRILFKTVGSYTMCMNSDFISSEPRVYAKYNDTSYLVRKEKDIDLFFANEALEEV